jgi:uncharacterized protein (TIGR02246 family)
MHGLSSVSADAQAIRDLTQRLAEAWNRNNGAAYAALFTEDCDYIAFDGTPYKGQRQNAELHQRLFETVLKGTRLVYEDVHVRFLTPDVAIMQGRGSVLMPWQREVAARRRSIQTYVVVKQGDEWRIAAFQNTRMRPLKLPSGLGLRLITWAMRLRTALSR